MFDGIVGSATIAKLQAGVAFTARRHEVIANNIANVQTPDYHAKDLSETSFAKALAAADWRRAASAEVIESPDAGPVREDGNNVSIEKEVSKLSRNAMRHNILISLLNKRFKGIESVLTGRVG